MTANTTPQRVYIVIDAPMHFADWSFIHRQCRSRDAAEKFVGARDDIAVLPIDAKCAREYRRGHYVHREQARRLAARSRAAE